MEKGVYTLLGFLLYVFVEVIYAAKIIICVTYKFVDNKTL